MSTNAVIDAGRQQEAIQVSVWGFANIARQSQINILEINQKTDGLQ